MSIKVHYSWILIIAAITAILTTQFSENYPLWQRITLNLVISLLFLTTMIIRELILSTVTLRQEAPRKKMVVFAFGGVYEENKTGIATTHLSLFYLARYLSNLVIAVIFYGLYASFINAGNLMLAGVAQWLTYIFSFLFLLHFVPAFPLDGGQILRMLLWRSSGDYYQATRVASLIGWIAGLFLIFSGILVFIITIQWAISLEIIIMGWILQIAAGYTRRKIKILTVLQNIRAQDIMTKEYPTMTEQVNIGQLIKEHILVKGWHYILVVEGVKLKGILTIRRVKSVPWKRWNNITIGDIMIPSDQIIAAPPWQTADILFDEMDQRRLDYVPVLEGGNLIGLVTREALTGLAKIRSGFGV